MQCKRKKKACARYIGAKGIVSYPLFTINFCGMGMLVLYKKIKKFFLFKLHKSLKNPQTRQQFLKEIHFINYQRFYILGFFILIFFFLILLINLLSLLFCDNYFFSHLSFVFYFHFTFFLYLLFILPILYLKRPVNKNKVTAWHHYAFVVSIFLFMVLVVAITSYGQKTHNHINAFILAANASAVFFIWRNRESIAFFSLSLLMLVIGIFLFQTRSNLIQSHLINAFLLTLISWIVSRIFYFSALRKFIYEITIRKQKMHQENLNQLLLEANHQLHESNELARLELNLAANLQRDFLFRNQKTFSGWEIGYLYQPASAVSGDFYDIFSSEDSLMSGVALFDVSGHGIGSGLITLLAKSIIFQNYRSSTWLPLGRIMKNINKELVREIGNLDNFITGVLLRVHKDYVEYANAGHPDILIKQHSTGQVITGKNENDPADTCLGLQAKIAQYTTYQIPFYPGDLFFIFSDGFFEAMEGADASGYDKLRELFQQIPSGLSIQESLNWLWEKYQIIAQNQIRKDDTTALLLRPLG